MVLQGALRAAGGGKKKMSVTPLQTLQLTTETCRSATLVQQWYHAFSGIRHFLLHLRLREMEPIPNTDKRPAT